MNSATPPVALGHGIHLIDTGFQRPRFDASYLLVEAGRAAFVDTGTHAAVPRLLGALDTLGVPRSNVDWVILTHVHLDHAGGAGLLLRQLPNARLVVHPRGARHMADPAQMMAGVRAVYGDAAVRRDYGELVPVDATRILATHDGMLLALGGRALRFLDTPGHARHHDCIWDEASRGCFTGDTLGVSYPELAAGSRRYALPSTSPVQFDLQSLHASIGRLLALDPQVAYLTHYGPVHAVAAHADLVLRQADAMATLARALVPASEGPQRLRAALVDLYQRELRACGNATAPAEVRRLLDGDVELNAQGLEHWVRGAGGATIGPSSGIATAGSTGGTETRSVALTLPRGQMNIKATETTHAKDRQ